MAPKITKRRDGDRWQICVNGKLTTLYIEKGEKPKYRDPQMYYLMSDDGKEFPTFLCEMNSVSRIMALCELIAEAVNDKGRS